MRLGNIKERLKSILSNQEPKNKVEYGVANCLNSRQPTKPYRYRMITSNSTKTRAYRRTR